ncbi:MAG TPA: c-type cytochrome [Acidimicrobiales bacterium]|nr:c-type cytochrome [Acidimicrobiales bacterium]
MSQMILAASTQRTIGVVIASVVAVGFLVYLLFSFRIGKKEIGSEIEIAANRKAHADDDELETRKLDSHLGWSLVTLAAISIILPLYWLMEPARQENAEYGWVKRFEKRGAAEYEEACAGCHGPGGVGGVTSYTLTDSNGGFVAQVDWKAPALTTVLSRFDESEVTHILNYGRGGSPMPAWGLPGGGPLTEQQIHQLVVYLRSIQLDQEDVITEVNSGLAVGARVIVANSNPELSSEEIDAAVQTWLEEASKPESENYLVYGELLFNNSAAQGANSCARCHTPGFSYGAVDAESTEELLTTWPKLEESGVLTGWQPGKGAVGPSLDGVTAHFPTANDQESFIHSGSEVGISYGNARSGTGGMPGFGGRVDDDLTDRETGASITYSQLYTPEQIAAIVAYERSLG